MDTATTKGESGMRTELDSLNDTAQTRSALGNIGRTKLYELTATGQIRSVKIGRRRFWPTSAIEDFIEGLSGTGLRDAG